MPLSLQPWANDVLQGPLARFVRSPDTYPPTAVMSCHPTIDAPAAQRRDARDETPLHPALSRTCRPLVPPPPPQRDNGSGAVAVALGASSERQLRFSASSFVDERTAAALNALDAQLRR